ncbi:CPBP family intramembrane glutamic endopeptidase [Anaerobacillus isosaccharinicus]|uniref:CPBP family intramembrane glutamic endopeptidase n=1 Tax=Anaerobacillus isosaccharinicus TaxID=1532552 RepID=A0A7S7RE54_9BACI|nr:CPBP family intramembrane metalloprotease [Anaerobacillus isosaccharinicus]QOY38705.1 CPBP family intramembrane metalloprotease [Anaerobacillus isosaccharinicus]
MELSKAIVLTITALCVAVNEEVIFRGAIVKGLLRFGANVTIFVPAVFFGLIHLGNLLGGGDLVFGIYQTLWAIAGGIALTALRLRNGSIYPAILFHFILDITEYFSTGENGVHQTGFSINSLTIFLILNVLFAIYAYIAFKKSKYNVINSDVSINRGIANLLTKIYAKTFMFTEKLLKKLVFEAYFT